MDEMESALRKAMEKEVEEEVEEEVEDEEDLTELYHAIRSASEVFRDKWIQEERRLEARHKELATLELQLIMKLDEFRVEKDRTTWKARRIWKWEVGWRHVPERNR